MLLADDTLQEVGLSTGIHYFYDFEKYLTILETGLQQKKTSVLNIFKQWAERIFPIEMYLLPADSEEEDDERVSHSIASLNPVVM